MPRAAKTPRSSAKTPAASSTANIGFEAKLWLAADKLRNNMDAAEYKHVVLGLIFLTYISDSFDEHRAKLLAGKGDYAGANLEDPDEPSRARQTAAGSSKGERGCANQYKAENVFWVPADARPGLDTARRGSALSPCEATRPGLKGNRGDIRNVGLGKWPLRQRPFGRINLTLRGIEAGLAVECAETVRRL